jgi:site-specific recombinase XerD
MNQQFKSTLENYRNFLKVKNYSINTIQNYTSTVEQFLIYHNKSGLHLTQKDFDKFLYSKNFSSISQQNIYISALILFYKHILKSKITKINLVRPRNEKHLPQIIDKDKILLSISQIKNLKHKSIISISYSVGLRVSEVINLKITDIDSNRMIIHIKNGKGRKDRIVPLSQNILELLREYYKQYKPKEYLFNGQNKQKYSSGSCNSIVKRYIGKEYHFHLLRHSCFTHLLEDGVDCHLIKRIAGHKDIKTTEGYFHVSKQTFNKIKLPI